MDQATRQCQNCKQDFVIEPDDFLFYEKIKVPPPTWCPKCRLVRRMSWYGQTNLFKRKCDFTGDSVITIFHPDELIKMYRQDVWWSDGWDPMDYGKEYDFSKPFFEQFNQLLRTVPLPALATEYTTMVNSDYCNAAAGLKNCYLCFRADGSENCAHCATITDCKDCFDVSFTYFTELSYESLDCFKCFRTFYSQHCEECHDVYFSKDCVGCTNCIGCINLKNKSYHIFNEPVSKAEYEAKLKELNLGSKEAVGKFKNEVDEFFLKHPRKQFRGRKNTNATGSYISNSKNVHDSYMMKNAEDVRYSQLLKAGPSKDCYDYTMFGLKAELIYESAWTGMNVRNIKFGVWNYNAHDLEYCFGCHGSENLFGCVGIRKGSYCILNKQYTKEDYLELLPKIKQQMIDMPYVDRAGISYRYGEFFPNDTSAWAYNESHAQEWFPLPKETMDAKKFRWRAPDQREYQDATIAVQDDIKDVVEDILKGILKCADCGKNYRIIQMEFNFYKKMNIPIPKHCPSCRERNRVGLLDPMGVIYDRTCTKCGKEIKTSYAPNRPEIVYCESCYQQEVA